MPVLLMAIAKPIALLQAVILVVVKLNRRRQRVRRAQLNTISRGSRHRLTLKVVAADLTLIVKRRCQPGLEPPVGSAGDSYDKALAETINGLYKAEVIHRLGPWRSIEQVEMATLAWVDWFNNRHLLSPIGHIPPAEAEARFYAQIEKGLTQITRFLELSWELCARAVSVPISKSV